MEEMKGRIKGSGICAGQTNWSGEDLSVLSVDSNSDSNFKLKTSKSVGYNIKPKPDMSVEPEMDTEYALPNFNLNLNLNLESSSINYGKLPDYVESLIKQMPSSIPDSPCQIIKLTPLQKYYMEEEVPEVPLLVKPEFLGFGDNWAEDCGEDYGIDPNEDYGIDPDEDYGIDPDEDYGIDPDEVEWNKADYESEDLIAAKRRLAEAMERKEDPDEHFFSIESYKKTAQDLATASLSFLRQKGECLELVKPSLFQCLPAQSGLRAHYNFQAKRTDVPGAPVETYFAQMCMYESWCVGGPKIVVECCVSLGQSDLLPYERDNRGCQYCTKYVHHPVYGCKGMKWGFKRWSEEKRRFVVI